MKQFCIWTVFNHEFGNDTMIYQRLPPVCINCRPSIGCQAYKVGMGSQSDQTNLHHTNLCCGIPTAHLKAFQKVVYLSSIRTNQSHLLFLFKALSLHYSSGITIKVLRSQAGFSYEGILNYDLSIYHTKYGNQWKRLGLHFFFVQKICLASLVMWPRLDGKI